MSEPTEDEIRANVAQWMVGRTVDRLPWTQKRFAFLLGLLDAERARADAAEAKVAQVRGFAEMSAIAAHAIGNKAEERTLLDALYLLDR